MLTRGLEMTLLKLIWDFYLENATPSTNTSCPANLKISEQNQVGLDWLDQIGLDLVETAAVIMQRGKQFVPFNIWIIFEVYL